MMNTHQPKEFALGRILVTSRALELIEWKDIDAALGRHARRDWGDLNHEQIRQNNLALSEGGRLFSAHADRRELRFYIVTDMDQRTTTLFLPGEN